MDEISIVIQGKAHGHSLSNIKRYREYGPVILSCYEMDDLSSFDLGDTQVIKSYGPLCNCTNGNIHYQCWTTLQGLNAVRTKYALKVRSDEKYENLQPIIDTIKANQDLENSFVSSNIFFKGKVEPLHPSDHLFGGSTFYLKRAFSILLNVIYNSPNPYLTGADFGSNVAFLGPIGAEVAIFLSYLISIGYLKFVNQENIHTYTLRFTDLVNIDNLGPYIWSMNLDGNRLYETTSDKLYEKYPSLKSKDEYFKVDYTI